MDQLSHVYIPFVAKQDGTQRLIMGPVSQNDPDVDEQIVDPDWLKGALPEWMVYGNIREQHNPARPVGKAVELNLKGAVPTITANIVDDKCWDGIKAGLFSGFSVGIKGARVVQDPNARNGRIVGGNVIEISVVDHPSARKAAFALLTKVAGGWKDNQTGATIEKGLSTEERNNLPSSDFADPKHRRFPIEDQSHLSAAASYRRYASPAVKERMTEIAHKEGLKIPDSLKKDDDKEDEDESKEKSARMSRNELNGALLSGQTTKAAEVPICPKCGEDARTCECYRGDGEAGEMGAPGENEHGHEPERAPERVPGEDGGHGESVGHHHPHHHGDGMFHHHGDGMMEHYHPHHHGDGDYDHSHAHGEGGGLMYYDDDESMNDDEPDNKAEGFAKEEGAAPMDGLTQPSAELQKKGAGSMNTVTKGAADFDKDQSAKPIKSGHPDIKASNKTLHASGAMHEGPESNGAPSDGHDAKIRLDYTISKAEHLVKRMEDALDKLNSAGFNPNEPTERDVSMPEGDPNRGHGGKEMGGLPDKDQKWHGSLATTEGLIDKKFAAFQESLEDTIYKAATEAASIAIDEIFSHTGDITKSATLNPTQAQFASMVQQISNAITNEAFDQLEARLAQVEKTAMPSKGIAAAQGKHFQNLNTLERQQVEGDIMKSVQLMNDDERLRLTAQAISYDWQQKH